METNLPIEIAVVKAKSDIFRAINSIGQMYQLPSILLSDIVQSIYFESRLSSYESAIAAVDIPKNNVEETVGDASIVDA